MNFRLLDNSATAEGGSAHDAVAENETTREYERRIETAAHARYQCDFLRLCHIKLDVDDIKLQSI